MGYGRDVHLVRHEECLNMETNMIWRWIGLAVLLFPWSILFLYLIATYAGRF